MISFFADIKNNLAFIALLGENKFWI